MNANKSPIQIHKFIIIQRARVRIKRDIKLSIFINIQDFTSIIEHPFDIATIGFLRNSHRLIIKSQSLLSTMTSKENNIRVIELSVLKVCLSSTAIVIHIVMNRSRHIWIRSISRFFNILNKRIFGTHPITKVTCATTRKMRVVIHCISTYMQSIDRSIFSPSPCRFIFQGKRTCRQ